MMNNAVNNKVNLWLNATQEANQPGESNTDSNLIDLADGAIARFTPTGLLLDLDDAFSISMKSASINVNEDGRSTVLGHSLIDADDVESLAYSVSDRPYYPRISTLNAVAQGFSKTLKAPQRLISPKPPVEAAGSSQKSQLIWPPLPNQIRRQGSSDRSVQMNDRFKTPDSFRAWSQASYKSLTSYSECSLGMGSDSDSEGRATPMPNDDRLTPTPGQSSSPINDHSASQRGFVSRQTNFGDSVAPSRAYGSAYGRTQSVHESIAQMSLSGYRSNSRADPRRPNPSTRVAVDGEPTLVDTYTSPRVISQDHDHVIWNISTRQMIFQEIGQFIHVDHPTMMWCCRHERYNEWALDKVELYQVEIDEDHPLDITKHVPLLLQQVNGHSIYGTDHVREYVLLDETTAISVQNPENISVFFMYQSLESSDHLIHFFDVVLLRIIPWRYHYFDLSFCNLLPRSVINRREAVRELYGISEDDLSKIGFVLGDLVTFNGFLGDPSVVFGEVWIEEVQMVNTYSASCIETPRFRIARAKNERMYGIIQCGSYIMPSKITDTWVSRLDTAVFGIQTLSMPKDRLKNHGNRAYPLFYLSLGFTESRSEVVQSILGYQVGHITRRPDLIFDVPAHVPMIKAKIGETPRSSNVPPHLLINRAGYLIPGYEPDPNVHVPAFTLGTNCSIGIRMVDFDPKIPVVREAIDRNLKIKDLIPRTMKFLLEHNNSGLRNYVRSKLAGLAHHSGHLPMNSVQARQASLGASSLRAKPTTSNDHTHATGYHY